MLIGASKNIANNGKGMYVGLKQPLGDGERCVTPARAAAKETSHRYEVVVRQFCPCNTKVLYSSVVRAI